MAASRVALQDIKHVLDCTTGLWEDLRGQRLFLTGGTGFFGCWLVESFCHANRYLELGAKATILTRDPERFSRKCPHLVADPAITLLRGDVSDFYYPDGEFPFVIHAATETRSKQFAEAPLKMLSTIIAGTERTLEFAATHGAKAFLLTSSGAVYGRQPYDLTHIPETYFGAPDPLNPESVYAEGKRVSELLCTLYATRSGMACKIARCWAFCGPHLPLDEHFAIGNFISDVLAGRPIQIKGDGTPRRSYLYAADLAVWLWTILFRAPSLTPFNVGSANDVSILELAQTVARTLKSDVEIRLAQKAVAGAPVARYVPCTDRASQILGLREFTTLEESIQRTAAWYRK